MWLLSATLDINLWTKQTSTAVEEVFYVGRDSCERKDVIKNKTLYRDKTDFISIVVVIAIDTKQANISDRISNMFFPKISQPK